MMKFIHFVFLLSVALHVFARATESSESESVDSSRSSSSEELRYNESLEDLVNVEDAGNSTATEVKDTEIAEKSSKDKKSDDNQEKVADEPAGKTDLEKFDKGLESDKKEYVQKRGKSSSDASIEQEHPASKGNSTESLTEDDMAMMDQMNKTMEADEEMLKMNETVLGIDTFGAQGI